MNAFAFAFDILHLLCQGFVAPELRVNLGLLVYTIAIFPSQQHLRHKQRQDEKG